MTNKSLLNSLNEAERQLVAETERSALAELDEDALVELHGRVRRARSKYVKQYRRGASARVVESGGRGKAGPKNRRAADKAEVFEDALARVSTSLAAAARRSAADLKAARIAASRQGRGGGSPVSSPDGSETTPKGRVQGTTRSPIERKKVASSSSTGARRQAQRDNR